MLVTRDVSQLEMSALKFCKRAKREVMSVMAETSQPAMGPYVAMASVELASYSWTAVRRSALVVKTRNKRRWVGGTDMAARSIGSHCSEQAP